MRVFIGAALLAVTISSVARADIQFYEQNIPGDVENVLFNDSTIPTSDIVGPAFTVRGHLSGTPTADCASGSLCVDVKSNENLFVNNTGGGQATIAASDGAFTIADIFLTEPPGGVYTKIVFALTGEGTGQDARATFDITVTEGNGNINTEQFTTGSGNTFYTVVAVSGQDIRNVNITAVSPDAFDTLKQLRIGTNPQNTPQGIPEPTSVVLLSSLVAAIAILRKRSLSVA